MSNENVYVLKVSPKTLSERINFLTNYFLDKNFDPKKKTIIKINGNFDYIYPGSNTSPWFLDALCQSLRDLGFTNLIVVEGDLLTFKAKDMIKKTKLINILNKYSIPFIDFENYPRDDSEIPMLFKDSQIINTPVPHGHGIATISCATKNLFGILPKNRRKYHKVLTDKLLELNAKLKMFTIVDATVALTGESTRRGSPFRLDMLLAGWSNLYIDIAIAFIMGYEPDEIELLRRAKGQGLIDYNLQLIGDYNKDSLPKYNLRFKHSSVRKAAMFLENTELENSKAFVSIETFLHKIYHYINFKRKRSALYSGPWMAYNNDLGGKPYF
jgi:uncharacterized protein (DUF362 family)